MTLAQSMALRMGVYLLLVLYLILDLFVLKGPVHAILNRTTENPELTQASTTAQGVVAEVYGRPIFRAQVEEAMKEFLWRRGRTLAETSPPERQLLRRSMVESLIDDELLKLQVRISASAEVVVPPDELTRAYETESQRYPNPEVFSALAERAHWDGLPERNLRIQARIQRDQYLDRMFKVTVSDAEARSWHDDHRDSFPADFETSRELIKDALLIAKRQEAWRLFRLDYLRHRAKDHVKVFKPNLFQETS